MRIMSFDVSSSTVGWAVFNVTQDTIKLYKCGYFKPLKKGNIFEKLTDLKLKILDLLKKYQPSEVAIEDIAKFMPKVSSAQTIIILALWNRAVGLTVFDYLGKPPELYSVMSIRHGLKKTKKLPKKEEIPTIVENILLIKLEPEFTKTGKIKPELYDQADAIACGLYHYFKTTDKLRKK